MVGFLLAAAYCVVDLSAGPQAKAYPVSYLEKEPVGGWGDAHRLDKMVLRRIEAKEPYYIGVFEVTQRQYELVTGRNPSGFKGEMRPVECVTWETVRGSFADHAWPKTTDVDGSRFVGRLRARTGLAFDLPSEAQWEYACRAGSTRAYANGDTPDDLRRIGRFLGNDTDGKGGFAEHTKVGSYAPNVWGLYDMHGNVWEWCLDGKNGVASNLFRMMRGGCWASGAEICTAYYRSAYLGFDWCKDVFMGLRLVVNLPSESNRTSVQSNVRTFELSNVSPNPIAPEGKFLADPAGRVGPDGVLRVFCSHDESAKYYCSAQNDILSTADLTHWVHAEAVFRGTDIGGGISPQTRLYAPDGIFLDGKWRLFYCTPNQGHSEGVAEAESAEGPYANARKLPVCRQFDPSVFRDDDGSVYLYWGQFTAKCAKLKPDLSGFEPGTLRESVIDAVHHHFHEGSQAFKRNGIYYLTYSDVSRGGCSCIGYSTAPTPFGPFTYRGVIIDNRGSDPCCNNNHGSVVEFGGRWYVFYHRQSNGVASLRKACVEPIEFDADGLIKEVEMTSNGAGAPLDPFVSTEARLACLLSGHVRVTTFPDGQERLTGIRAGDTVLWRYFDFKKPAKELELACVAEAGGSVEVLDAKGNVIGKGSLPAGDGKSFSRMTVALEKPIACGRGAIRMRFAGAKGVDLFQLESFTAKNASERAAVARFRPNERVVFLGDSITHLGQYVGFLQLFAALRHPGMNVRCFNRGIGGQRTRDGLSRIDWDVLPVKPDRVFVMFGMNDVGSDKYCREVPTEAEAKARAQLLAAYGRNLRELIARITASDMQAVMMTPSPYDQYGELSAANKVACNEPGLASCAKIVREIADERKVGLVEFHRPMTELVKAHPDLHLCGPDRVHPGAAGHLLLAALVWESMGESPVVARIEVDAKKGEAGKTDNAAVTSVTAGPDGVRFTYAPKALPLPLSPAYREDDKIYPLTERFNQETFVVKGLGAGRHDLVFDGVRVGTFTAAEFERGVNVALLPTPNQKLAQTVAAWTDDLVANENLRRTIVRTHVVLRGGNVSLDDFAAQDAFLDAWIAKMKEEKCPWYKAQAQVVAGYRQHRERAAELARTSEALTERINATRPLVSRVSVLKAGARGQGLDN